ncbi:helix-turn-helix domain-containing protein [Bradyrhizobium sp. HKCCYLR20261]|uniref:helix-turn-helix domain-containing protein n=1 Tax=Bradyrhizobium sp. HKCCYLR20261 TaxID=3420760 RepID=UPI003EBABDC0
MGYLSAKQVAAKWGVTKEHVRRLANEGRLSFVNVGMGPKRPRMRFDPEEVRLFEERQKKLGTACPPSTRTASRRTGRSTSGSMDVSFRARLAARESAKQGPPPSR